MDKLTTAQAAQVAGVSRYTLNRAKKSGVLHPVRDNRGGLLWDAVEVERWAAERAAQGAQSGRAQDDATPAAQAEVEVLRARLADAETRAAVAEALAAERAERIADLRAALADRRRGWWPFGG